jgi:hypothetical protein
MCIPLLLTFGSVVVTGRGSEDARLSVVVSTTFGEPLAKARLVLNSVGPHREWRASSNVKGEAEFQDVPFGLFDLQINVPGFESRHERIGIYQNRLSIRLGLALGYPHSTDRPEIVGSVSPVSAVGPDRWVRLVSLFGSDLVENAVDRSGGFHLVGMAPGRYLLIVLEADKVAATKAVEVLPGRKTIDFSLDQGGESSMGVERLAIPPKNTGEAMEHQIQNTPPQ